LLVLRELEGRSYEDIGSRLGISRPMVESGLFRARRKLSEEYDELVTGRRCAAVQASLTDGDEHRLRRLGVRERRQLARHLCHCQPCRRVARAAGLSDDWLRPPSLAARIAALLPLPGIRWRGSRGSGSAGASLRQVPPVGSLAPLADPTGPLQSLGRAAGALAAILVAGIGGNVVAGHPGAPETATRPAAAAAPAPAAISAVPVAPPQGAQPSRIRATPARSRAGQTVTLRTGGAGSRPRPAAAFRPSGTHPGTQPLRGAGPPSRSPIGARPARRLLASALGSASNGQSAGAVLGSEADLAGAVLATAQSVDPVSAVPSSLAHTITAAGGAVAASAGTAAVAGGSSTGGSGAPR
jgi:hypothetical protein